MANLKRFIQITEIIEEFNEHIWKNKDINHLVDCKNKFSTSNSKEIWVVGSKFRKFEKNTRNF